MAWAEAVHSRASPIQHWGGRGLRRWLERGVDVDLVVKGMGIAWGLPEGVFETSGLRDCSRNALWVLFTSRAAFLLS